MSEKGLDRQIPGAATAASSSASAQGVALIAAERLRQIEDEGWTAEHDDDHNGGELALAACCYAMPVQLYRQHPPLAHATLTFSDPWPWGDGFDKRKSGNVPHLASTTEERIGWLVKAGALIAAEIDRLGRSPATSDAERLSPNSDSQITGLRKVRSQDSNGET